MRKIVLLFLAGVLALSLCACSLGGTCHHCGKNLTSDPVKYGGRSYCSHDCYMRELLGLSS